MHTASAYMDRRGIQKRQDGVLCPRSCAMVTYLLTMSSHRPFLFTSVSSPCDAMSSVDELPRRTAINGSEPGGILFQFARLRWFVNSTSK